MLFVLADSVQERKDMQCVKCNILGTIVSLSHILKLLTTGIHVSVMTGMHAMWF